MFASAMIRKTIKELRYPLLIVIYSIAIYIYINQNHLYYNLIKYYMSERTFYIIITTLIISINAYILIQIIIRYFQIKKMLITRIGKRKYNIFLIKRLIAYILMISITNTIIDALLFYTIDIFTQISSVFIGLIVIPFLTSDNLKQYNYVLCIILMFISRIVLSLFI